MWVALTAKYLAKASAGLCEPLARREWARGEASVSCASQAGHEAGVGSGAALSGHQVLCLMA